MTHSDLCALGAKYMQEKGLLRFQRPKYVVVEIQTMPGTPRPDIYGFGGAITQQIEVKVGRGDFLKDRNKTHRQDPDSDVGELRSYLCQIGLIKPDEVPPGWGLLYCDTKNNIRVIKEPSIQESNMRAELTIISSVLRRVKVRPQIFDFRNEATI